MVRYRIKDVGRKGHHYLQVRAGRKKGKRGGYTKGTLVTKAELRKRIAKARRKWMSMGHKARMRAMPNNRRKR